MRPKKNDGSGVEYYRMAHNDRHPVTRNPVAKIIHHFGWADRIDRDLLIRLYASIPPVCGGSVVNSESVESKQLESGTFPENLKIMGTCVLGTV